MRLGISFVVLTLYTLITRPLSSISFSSVTLYWATLTSMRFQTSSLLITQFWVYNMWRWLMTLDYASLIVKLDSIMSITSKIVNLYDIIKDKFGGTAMAEAAALSNLNAEAQENSWASVVNENDRESDWLAYCFVMMINLLLGMDKANTGILLPPPVLRKAARYKVRGDEYPRLMIYFLSLHPVSNMDVTDKKKFGQILGSIASQVSSSKLSVYAPAIWYDSSFYSSEKLKGTWDSLTKTFESSAASLISMVPEVDDAIDLEAGLSDRSAVDYLRSNLRSDFEALNRLFNIKSY